jgi:type IV pilus assembly protein PilM
MAKRANSVVGIDLGKRAFKAVLLQKKSDSRFVLTNFATRTVSRELTDADAIAQELKPLLRELGGNAKGCAVAVSEPEAFLRIIEQPETPTDLLRNAMRLNGLAVLNQDCKEYVIDVALAARRDDAALTSDDDGGDVAVQVATKTRYLVGGMPRAQVKTLAEGLAKAKLSPDILQLAPVCSFNAFEFAYPEIFANDAFLLLDLGHLQSTVQLGNRGELVLVRNIEYGGKHLLDALTADGALDPDAAQLMLQQNDAGMSDICHMSLMRLATEVRNSIGFFEGQSEQSIGRIFVSGGLARTEMILQTLSDELTLPCEIWDPLEMCEVALPAAKRQALPKEFVSLNVACGAAFEYLRS